MPGLTHLVGVAAGERQIQVGGDAREGGAGVQVALLAAGAGPLALQVACEADRAVLDADAIGLRGVATRRTGSVIWCSLDASNPLIAEHLELGGDACLVDAGQLWLCAGPARVALATLDVLMPASGGLARERLQEALLFLGAAVALDLSLAAVRQALASGQSATYGTLGP